MVLATLQYTIIAVKIPVEQLCIKTKGKKVWNLLKKTRFDMKNLLVQ